MQTDRLGKLFNRVIVIHVITGVLLIFLITGVLGIIQYKNLNKEMLRIGKLAATHLSIAGVDPIVQTLAYDRISETINNIFISTPHIQYIVIYGLTGNVVAFCGSLEDSILPGGKINKFYKNRE